MTETLFVNSQLEQIANYRSRADENIRIVGTWINGKTPVATVIEGTACMVSEPVVYFSAGVYVDGSLMKHYAERYFPREEKREIKLNLAVLAGSGADSKEVMSTIEKAIADSKKKNKDQYWEDCPYPTLVVLVDVLKNRKVYKGKL